MRITNTMMVNTMMRNIYNNLNTMANLDNQMSTGKIINMPSDDPVGITKVLKLSSDIAAHEQYKKNVDGALSWMQATETSVMQLKDVMQRVRELTARGATGALTDEDKQAMKSEITQLKEQIVSIGNSNYSGKYIFAGYKTTEKPFTIEETAVGSKLKYNGEFLSPGGIVDDSISDADFQNFLTNKNNKKVTQSQMADKMDIEIGVGDITNVNLNGAELFGNGFGGVFETLTKLEKDLNGESSYKHGFVDMQYATGEIDYTDLDNTAEDKAINIKIGNDSFDLKLPSENLTKDNIQKAIDDVDYLKKNGVKVSLDTTNNKISFSAQEEIIVKPKLGDTVISTDEISYNATDLNTGETRNLKITMNGTDYNIALPAGVDLDETAIQTAIDTQPDLLAKEVKIKIDDVNHVMSFSAKNETIKVDGTFGATDFKETNEISSKQQIAPILIGERMKGTLETDDTDNFKFDLTVNGTKKEIGLPKNKKYELDTKMGKAELLKDIQEKIDENASLKGKVEVSFTEDNRLKFSAAYKDASSASFDDISISNNGASSKFVTKLGFVTGQTSENAVIKTEEIDTSAMLDDLDKNIDSILAKLSELGAKTNRLELDKNRLEDNILNFTGLLSKTQDADMAETILKYKMAENIYKSSLSTGAKIIQPTLLDFIR